MAKPWTKHESTTVFSGVGSYGWSGLQSRAGDSYTEPGLPPGRSIEAVRRRIRRMGNSGARRGAFSVRQLSVETGYNRAQLRRAQSALNQKWMRMGRRGAHLISDEQAQDLVVWLSHDYWNMRKRLYGCRWCSTSVRPHRSSGLCARCVHRYRRRCLELGLPTSLKEQKEILDDTILDCANRAAHGKILENSRRQLDRGLALTEEMLERVATTYERNSDSGVDP